jgi:hypothetical protein
MTERQFARTSTFDDDDSKIRIRLANTRTKKYSDSEETNHFKVPKVEKKLPLDMEYDKMFKDGSVNSAEMSSYWYLSAFVLGMMSTFAGVCGKGTAASVLGGLSGAASTATKDMGSYSYDRAKELRSIKMAQDLWQRDTVMDTKFHLISINSELFQNEEQLINDLRITSKESQR